MYGGGTVETRKGNANNRTAPPNKSEKEKKRKKKGNENRRDRIEY